MREFVAHPWLHNRHVMTMAAAFWPRRKPRNSLVADRWFETEPGTQLLVKCQWQPQPRECPALVLVHGLEGSSESGYMLGVGEAAFTAGFSVLRVNQRNCGGTERYTPTLYNSGLSGDYRAILRELLDRDRLPAICFAGYSMGGNLVLKMAGELGADAPREMRAVCGVCPTIELAACADALEKPGNRIYQWNFVRHLIARVSRKQRLFPKQLQFEGLERVRTVREFDEVVTAPSFGFAGAADYYERSSAARVVDNIAIPTLMLTAQDDPFVPFAPFQASGVTGNSRIQVVAPELGGHCGFISRSRGQERFWAEPRIVEFCKTQCGL